MQRARVDRWAERDAAAMRDQHDAAERRPTPRPGIQPGVLPFAPELNVEYDDLKKLCAATQHALNSKFIIGEP